MMWFLISVFFLICFTVFPTIFAGFILGAPSFALIWATSGESLTLLYLIATLVYNVMNEYSTPPNHLEG